MNRRVSADSVILVGAVGREETAAPKDDRLAGDK